MLNPILHALPRLLVGNGTGQLKRGIQKQKRPPPHTLGSDGLFFPALHVALMGEGA